MTAEEILTKLQASFPGLVKSEAPVKDYPTWTVPAESVRAVFERLHSKFLFNYLDVVTATDLSGKTILLVEDILETGGCLMAALQYLLDCYQ